VLPTPLTGGIFIARKEVFIMTNATQTTAPRFFTMANAEQAAKFCTIANNDREAPGELYTAAEVERALQGFTKFIIQAATDNISSTEDLTSYLLEVLTEVKTNHFEKWIESEQVDLASNLF
jgi:hypothetical protein